MYFEQMGKFKDMVEKHTRVEKDVIITDLRGMDPICTGNRFLIYSMYPKQNISVWIVNGKGGARSVILLLIQEPRLKSS